MVVKTGELEAELIDAVCARVRERLPGTQAAPCESFVRQYYQWVPLEDLTGRDPLDLYGAAVAHWNLAQQREPGEVKVHVYNPDFEQHGWRSPHTVIELVTDDMPFLVDSVTMELGRQGFGIDLVIHPVMTFVRDEHGHLLDVLEPGSDEEQGMTESILHAEVAPGAGQGAPGRACRRGSSACSVMYTRRCAIGARCGANGGDRRRARGAATVDRRR